MVKGVRNACCHLIVVPVVTGLAQGHCADYRAAMRINHPVGAAPRHPGERTGRRRFVAMLVWDIALPLAMFYGLRVLGLDVWQALVAGVSLPAARLGVAALRRRIEFAGVFSVSIMFVGTGIGLLTGDARLLLVRESYLTAVVGPWIWVTLLMRRPLVFTATVGFMAADAARAWECAWIGSGRFRHTMRVMTAGFGVAFLVDAAARVVMAYTLPLDLVPVLGVAVLLTLLVSVVQVGKWYGRRHLTEVLGMGPGGSGT